MFIKFGHSEKATKIWNNLQLDLTCMYKVNMWEIVSNFVAFLENLNFKNVASQTIWILIVRLFPTYLKTKGISNTYLLFYFLFRLDSCSESHELRCVISCVYASSAILRAILLASNIPQGSHGTIGSKTFWIRIQILVAGAPASLKCKYVRNNILSTISNATL